MKITQFYLNKNKYKTEDKHPGYVAQIKQEDGTWLKIASAWVGKDKDGNSSISVKLADGVFLEGTPTYKPKPKTQEGEALEDTLDF